MTISSNSFRHHACFSKIKELYENYQSDITYFQKEVLPNHPEANHLYTNYNSHYGKIFLVACANSFEQYFEKHLPDILGFTTDTVHHNFMLSQALKRKYFTLFNWEQNNTNQFFKLFGDKFQEHMKEYRKTDENFKTNESLFIELGKYRNKIVHNGMMIEGEMPSIQRAYTLFLASLDFCDVIFQKLSTFKGDD